MYSEQETNTMVNVTILIVKIVSLNAKRFCDFLLHVYINSKKTIYIIMLKNNKNKDKYKAGKVDQSNYN